MATTAPSRMTREEQQLRQIIQDIPGNNECADCTTPAPAWAAYNIGIFLCTRCASLHRKMGTHVSRVKSISLDSWTSDQVDTMRSIGNTISNYNLNPLREWPLREDDYGMEQFIRDKYERKKFTTQRETGSFRPIKSALKGSSAVTETPAFSATANRYAKEMSTLRDMGFTNRAQLVDVLTQTNGDLAEATERLLNMGPTSNTTASGRPEKPKRPRVRFTLDTIGGEDTPVASNTNPFDLWAANRQSTDSKQPIPSSNPNPFSSIPPSLYHNPVFTGMQSDGQQPQAVPLRPQLTGGQPLRPQTAPQQGPDPVPAGASMPSQYGGAQPIMRQQTGPQIAQQRFSQAQPQAPAGSGPGGAVQPFRAGGFDSMQEQLARMEQTLGPAKLAGLDMQRSGISMQTAPSLQSNVPVLSYPVGPQQQATLSLNQHSGNSAYNPSSYQSLAVNAMLNPAQQSLQSAAPYAALRPQHTGGSMQTAPLPQQYTGSQPAQNLTATQAWQGRSTSPFVSNPAAVPPSHQQVSQGYTTPTDPYSRPVSAAGFQPFASPNTGAFSQPSQLNGGQPLVQQQMTGYGNSAVGLSAGQQSQLPPAQANSHYRPPPPPPPPRHHQQAMPSNFGQPGGRLAAEGGGFNPMQPFKPFDKSGIMSLYAQGSVSQRVDSPVQGLSSQATGQTLYGSAYAQGGQQQQQQQQQQQPFQMVGNHQQPQSSMQSHQHYAPQQQQYSHTGPPPQQLPQYTGGRQQPQNTYQGTTYQY